MVNPLKNQKKKYTEQKFKSQNSLQKTQNKIKHNKIN